MIRIIKLYIMDKQKWDNWVILKLLGKYGVLTACISNVSGSTKWNRMTERHKNSRSNFLFKLVTHVSYKNLTACYDRWINHVTMAQMNETISSLWFGRSGIEKGIKSPSLDSDLNWHVYICNMYLRRKTKCACDGLSECIVFKPHLLFHKVCHLEI